MDRGMLGYPVATAKEILQDPQLKERKFWQDVRIPGSERTLRFPGGFAIVNGKRLQVRVPDRAPDEEVEEAERRKRS
jgi:crotonobetainyl-CoA:carnitine CoA-transferase CaiB-like acyl-CoA transferase